MEEKNKKKNPKETSKREEKPKHAQEPIIEQEDLVEEQKEEPETEEQSEIKQEEKKIEEEKKEPAPEEKINKEKKKNKKLIILIVALITLIVGLVIFIIWKTTDKKDNSNNQETNEVVATEENDMYPPKDAKIIDSSNMPNHLGELSLHCMLEGTLTYVEDASLKPGDIIECSTGLEVMSSFKIDTVYFELQHGSGLEYLEKDVEKSGLKIEGNRTKYSPSKPSAVLEFFSKYKFRIASDATRDNLTINISDIVIKTVTNDYYSLDDKEKSFTLVSDVYYIYESYDDVTGERYLDAYEEKGNYADRTYVTEYKCANEGCVSSESGRGSYALFEDGGYVAFNVDTEQRIDLSEFNKYDDIDLVSDDKLRGVIVYRDGKSGYYSLEKKKFVVNLSSDHYILPENDYIYISGESPTLIDFQGNEYKASKKTLTRYEDTDFYYIRVAFGISSYTYFFYNKDGTRVLKNYDLYVPEQIAPGEDGNIIIINKTSFTEYDINENVIYKSKNEYTELGSAYEYIIAVDKDYNLKLINTREAEVVSFEKLPKNYYIHWMLSGYYDYDEKRGIYILVETDEVTDQEILDTLKPSEEDKKYYLEETRGYEYYYIPETKEKGKEATIIGGYAKPILYLYPEKDNTKITVSFEKPNLLTTTYPKYTYEWKVTANKNGDLYDKDNKYYYGLYWEEEGSTYVDFKEGFYVTKDNAIDFLEEKLTTIGLNDKERNEFIMYWLPILEKNGQNLVYFELTEERDAYNKLNITPKPDSLLRVAIHVKKVNKKTKIKEQKLPTFNRTGFTAVEWGGVIH